MSEQVHRDFLNPLVLSRLAALPLHARLPMLGNVSGRHRSPIRGSSIEFSAYRKYVPGDDTRRLDWRAYARSDRYYIKEFEADTNLRLCLVVDTSGSMNYGSAETTKLDYARHLAGTLAYLAARQGDAVGLYCAADGFTREIPPKRNAAHLRNVLDELGNVNAEGETGLAEALHEAAERVPQRALIIVISDLFVDPGNCAAAFSISVFANMTWRCFTCWNKTSLSLPSTVPCDSSIWKVARPYWLTPRSSFDSIIDRWKNIWRHWTKPFVTRPSTTTACASMTPTMTCWPGSCCPGFLNERNKRAGRRNR